MNTYTHRRQPRAWVIITAGLIAGEAAIWFMLRAALPAYCRIVLYIAGLLGRWPL